MSVSILDGQLTRTWKYPVRGRTHVINLYHDTISGVRSVMVDYEEVRGSMGNSSLVMEATGHRIPFQLPGEDEINGYIMINREGWFGFEYACVVLGQQIKEVTHDLKNVDGDTFKCEVSDTITTPCIEDSTQPVVYYKVNVTRCSDGVSTVVHRRFRDFATMNSQIKQNLKGHQIWSSLPNLPEKTLKFLVDHNDPAFISERQICLHTYLGMIVNMPHVNEMTCVKSFLGLMDKVTEYSTVFHTPQLGLSVTPGASIVVSAIQDSSFSANLVRCGDALSKIAGVPIAGTSFNAIVTYLKTYPRPLIVHFTRVIGAPAYVPTNDQEKQPQKPLPSPSGPVTSAAQVDKMVPAAVSASSAAHPQRKVSESTSASNWPNSLSPAPYATKDDDPPRVSNPPSKTKTLEKVAEPAKPRGIATIDASTRSIFLGIPGGKEHDTLDNQSI